MPAQTIANSFELSSQKLSPFSDSTLIIIIFVLLGESGSGKTEASKYVMHYIATMSQSMEIARVKNLLIVSNPLLEAFGNAQTIRNDNSSRFVRRYAQSK